MEFGHPNGAFGFLKFPYSKESLNRLKTCDLRLQLLMRHAANEMDLTILAGFRGQEEQNAFFASGKSKLPWPRSPHNKEPSHAVDVCPHPWDFKDPDYKKLHFMAGLIMGIASRLNIKIRWGGDWDRDLDFKDQVFDDLYHFELV